MRRADAIVRCALDLGLRSGEVARLSLDDIDWRAGTVTLRHTKGCREDLLPLPATTGKAIAAYLKHERPRTTNRAVFVRQIAPRDEPAGPDLVRKAIRQAYARAGLPYTRSHLLRHTMANRLLAEGSSLKEVECSTSTKPNSASHAKYRCIPLPWTPCVGIAGCATCAVSHLNQMAHSSSAHAVDAEVCRWGIARYIASSAHCAQGWVGATVEPTMPPASMT
jgi:hypothetical protein